MNATADKPKLPEITDEEFMTISVALSERHAVYNRFWEFGRPHFTDAIPTAAIVWDKEFHRPMFCFSPKFWEKLTLDQRIVVIAHEMLHVILNHGKRFEGTKKSLRRLVNPAADIVVNHTLVEKFGFTRSEFPDADNLCWVDTIFPDEKTMPTDKHVEFYLSRMPEPPEMPMGGKGKKGDGSGGGGGDGEPHTLDEHDADLTPEEIDKIIGRLNDDLSDDEKEEIQGVIEDLYEGDDAGDDGDGVGGKEAGKSGTGKWSFVKKEKVVIKRKWETVINKWARKRIIPEMKGIERWGRRHRRLSAVDFGRMKLPCEMEADSFRAEPKVLTAYFFLDVSGSCSHLVDRFVRAALSLPPDRFATRLFWFNTAVGEIDKETLKIKIGGGTSFSCIVDAVNRYSAEEGIDYPDAVWVITDGYGNPIQPQNADRWYWFLSEVNRSCIPAECNTFMLSEFE